MLNFGSWAGRLHAVLGAPCGTSALPADLSPNLQSIRRVRVRSRSVRLSASESVVGPLHAVLGGVPMIY